MKYRGKISLLLVSLLAGNCSGVEASVKGGMTYHLNIPNCAVEYTIPTILQEGYGPPVKSEIDFTNPEADQFAGAIGEGAFSKDIARFYLGATHNFKSWDANFNIIVIRFDRTQRPVTSTIDLATFVKRMLSQNELLDDGTQLETLGSVSVQRVGKKDVVVAISAERTRVASVRLANGATTETLPFEFYYILLNEEWAIAIRVYHENPRAVNQEMFRQTQAIVHEIVRDMKVAPK